VRLGVHRRDDIFDALDVGAVSAFGSFHVQPLVRRRLRQGVEPVAAVFLLDVLLRRALHLGVDGVPRLLHPRLFVLKPGFHVRLVDLPQLGRLLRDLREQVAVGGAHACGVAVQVESERQRLEKPGDQNYGEAGLECLK
jgi:hypothetical protein